MSSSEEAKFLASYSADKYFRPSFTADVVAFSMIDDGLSVLLIQRGNHPFKGFWALPGGFMEKDENAEQCAIREMQEETGVTLTSLIPIGLYSDVGRDPRGRIISQAYAAILNAEATKVISGDDACDAKWFAVKLSDSGRLTLSDGKNTVSATLTEVKTPFGTTAFKITDNDGIAFDHASVIAKAIRTLRSKADDPEILFGFLPEKFTLTQMQRTAEILSGKKLTASNFRRKTEVLVTSTDEYTVGQNHRPARLFKRSEF